jgi:1-acyl-sn-glycerol-3-phosphate acyltransferase
VKIRTIVVGGLAVLCLLILSPVLLVCWFVRFPLPILLAGKGFVVLAQGILGLRVEISGREKIRPGGQYIYMANHQSFLDGPLVYWAVPGFVRVILKREVFRVPILGQGMLLAGFVPVDRKGLRGGRRSLDRAAANMARRKFSYLVFPEGTRTRDGNLQPFKRGGFFLALEAGVPIVPITVRGTYPLMPRGRPFVRKGPVDIIFHPPIPLDGFSVESLPGLIEAVRAAIASDLEAKEQPPWTSAKKAET